MATPAPTTAVTPKTTGTIGPNAASKPVPLAAAPPMAAPIPEAPSAAAAAAGATFSASKAVLLNPDLSTSIAVPPIFAAADALPMTPAIPDIPLLKATTGLRAPPIRELTGPTTAANAANLIMVCCVPLSIFEKALTTSVAVLIRGVSVGRSF